MDDDLNISAAMASIFRTIKKVNTLKIKKAIDPEGANRVVTAMKDINTVLNFINFDDNKPDPEIQRLISEREKARKNKNWELSDEIREQLLAKGVNISDDKY